MSQLEYLYQENPLTDEKLIEKLNSAHDGFDLAATIDRLPFAGRELTDVVYHLLKRVQELEHNAVPTSCVRSD